MLNTIKKFFTGFNNYPVVHLGRWSIKHEIDHCNRYMQHLHADPGYYSPGIIYKETNVHTNVNSIDTNENSLDTNVNSVNTNVNLDKKESKNI